MLINSTRIRILRLNNRLVAEERVLDSHLHHNFGNFHDTKISLKKVQSNDDKEKKSIVFPGNFS